MAAVRVMLATARGHARGPLAVVAALLVLFVSFFAQADVPVPKFDQRCKDLAKIMSEEERVDLDRRLVAYEQATGNQIAILVIKSLEGEPIEDYAFRVFKEWKLGDEQKDNGILIVAAIKERRLRFEIGKGLEGDLTDLEASLIIREQMRPFTKQERWHEAFQAGLAAIEKKLSGKVYGPVPERPRETASHRGTDYQGYFLTAIFLLVFVIVILRALKGGGRGGGGGGPPIIFFGGGGWGGGGGGGGGYGGPMGGGGESGGGGASEDV